MKTAVAFLAPAECLLVPTCSLAISKRAIFFFFFFFWWPGIAGGCKSSKTHTPTARSVEWIWVTVCRLFGWTRGDAPFKVLLSQQQHQFTADSNIQLLELFPFLFCSVQSKRESTREARSLLFNDWHSWWCLSLLSLTFNSQEWTHKHAHGHIQRDC